MVTERRSALKIGVRHLWIWAMCLLCFPAGLWAQNVYVDIISPLDITYGPTNRISLLDLGTGSYMGTRDIAVDCQSDIQLRPSFAPTGDIPLTTWSSSVTPGSLAAPGGTAMVTQTVKPSVTLSPGDYHAGTMFIGGSPQDSSWKFPGPETNLYGLFVGAQVESNGTVLRGDLDATRVYDAVRASVPNFTQGILLTDNVSQSAFQSAINTLRYSMKANDQLLIYASLPGSQGGNGGETTATAQDELLGGFQPYPRPLSDDNLKAYLTATNMYMDGIQKWVMLDGCYSGGFWGNNSTDAGDLEKVANTSLLAAAPENGLAYFDGTTGLSYFGNALVEAFSTGSGGSLNGDLDHNGSLTSDELASWVQDYSGLPGAGSTVYEKAFGDPVSWSSDLWEPVSYSSPGFAGGLQTPQPVPVPGAVLLGALGLSFAGWRLKRQTV